MTVGEIRVCLTYAFAPADDEDLGPLLRNTLEAEIMAFIGHLERFFPRTFRYALSPALGRATGLALFLFLSLRSSALFPVQAQEPSPPAAGADRVAGTEALPLDPLTPQERAAAERIARADKRVIELLSEAGVRAVSVELLAIKPESLASAQQMPRRAEVILFFPEREVGARIAVNLQRKAVEQVERIPGTQVPMTEQDLTDAFRLVLRDPELQKILPEVQSFRVQSATDSRTLVPAENMVTGLPLRGTEEKDPCTKHRCMQLFFKRGRDYFTEASVIVDLSAKHVYVERSRSR